jgi:hypothetical protein
MSFAQLFKGKCSFPNIHKTSHLKINDVTEFISQLADCLFFLYRSRKIHVFLKESRYEDAFCWIGFCSLKHERNLDQRGHAYDITVPRK